MNIATIEWIGGPDGHIRLIDQTLLPGEYKLIECTTVKAVWEAIKVLRVRGAPAIGVAGAMGVVVALRNSGATSSEEVIGNVGRAADYLATSRPTAVNLFWALDRMRQTAKAHASLPPPLLRQRLLEEALAILTEDDAMCHAMGRHGAALLHDGDGVLTHCNAGGLATSGYGTALACLYAAHEAGKRLHVFADETRPLLQGARLTAWELSRAGIEVTLICDNAAAKIMSEGRVQRVIVGADRIAANGDTANKVGTYGVALLAHAHRIPFCVAAPSSTFDLAIDSGAQITIEERDAAEVTHLAGRPVAPPGVRVRNPAFDVTPARLISAIITERGVIERPTRRRIAKALAAGVAPGP